MNAAPDVFPAPILCIGVTHIEALSCIITHCREQVATDHALDLPPRQEDIGFLRQAQVMATLCHYAYSFKPQDVGSTSSIELRLAGMQHDTTTVSATLLHFRQVTALLDPKLARLAACCSCRICCYVKHIVDEQRSQGVIQTCEHKTGLGLRIRCHRGCEWCSTAQPSCS